MTTEARQIGRNFSLTFAGRLVLYGLSAAWTIYLAPALGDRDFGLYTIVRAMVDLFALLPDMGIGLVVIRDVAADHSRTSSYLLNSFLAKLMLAGLALLVLVVLSALLYPDIPLSLFMMAGFGVMAQAVGMVPVQGLQAVEQMGAAAVVELTSHLVFIGAGFALVLGGYGVEGVLWAMVLSGVVALLVGGAVLVLRFKPRVSEASLGQTRYLLREGFPLGLSAALGMVYLKADKLILGRMVGEAAVGWYNAAYVLYFTLIEIISTPVSVASYPTLSRYHKADPVAFGRFLQKLVYGLLLLSLPLALGGALTAGPLLDFLYRGAYVESGPVLVVLLWSLVPIFPGALLTKLLIIRGQQQRVLWLRALSAALMVLLTPLMVGLLGYVGPAAAILAVQGVMLALVLWWLRALLPDLRLGSYLPRVFVALLPMAAACVLLREAHVLLAVAAAALVYGGALVGLGVLRREDWRMLRAALGR